MRLTRKAYLTLRGAWFFSTYMVRFGGPMARWMALPFESKEQRRAFHIDY
jgi:hypothetical protein